MPVINTFNPSDITHLAVLSRIVEALRFSVGPQLLGDALTCESMQAAFTQHVQILADCDDHRREVDVAENGDRAQHKVLTAQQKAARAARDAEMLADIDHHLKVVWDVIHREHLGDLKWTFGDAFDFEFASFPETTSAQRVLLNKLADLEIVTRQDVRDVLQVTDDDQLLQFIFASGAAALPREVFRDVVGCLDQHPRCTTFAQRLAHDACSGGFVMSKFILQMALLIAVLIISPGIVKSSHVQAYENAFHWLNNDWTQGCPNGPESPLGCNFLGRNFLVGTRPETDVLRYFRYELINILWRGEEQQIDNRPLGGYWPVGTLLIRGVRSEDDPTSSPGSCESLNLTTYTTMFEVPARFPCSHEWAISIPYTVNRTTALDMASQVQLPAKATHSSFAIFAHFSAYNPSHGIAVYAKVIVALPKGGGAMTRLLISPMDPSTHEPVLPWLILRLVGFAWAIICAIRYGRVGIAWVFDMMFETGLTALIVASYVSLRGVGDLIDNVAQTSWNPSGFDTAQDRYDVGMSLLGFFVFFSVASVLQFAKHINGLQLLADILSAATVEIVGLIFMFLIWSVSFITIGMVLFGSSVPDFASFGLAARSLLYYFPGLSDFDLLFDNNPIIGPVYFFAFSMFVTFFALNLLVAVLTAPLGKVKEKNALQRRTYEEVHALLGESALKTRLWLTVQYYVIWPTVNIVLDASVITQGHWINLLATFDTFYGISTGPTAESARKVCRAGAELLRMMTSVTEYAQGPDGDAKHAHNLPSARSSSMASEMGLDRLKRHPNLWRSALATVVVNNRVIQDELALAFTFVAISEETKSTLLRDARLMKFLRDYDAFQQTTCLVHDLQLQLMSDAQETSIVIARAIDRATALATVITDDAPPLFEPSDPTTTRATNCVLESLDVPAAAQHSPRSERLPSSARSHVSLHEDTEVALDLEASDASAFQFTRMMSKKVSSASQLLFYTLLSIVFMCLYLGPFTVNYDTTAYLVRSLNTGLRDHEIHQECYDANCLQAWSMNKTLMSVGDLSEYYQWLNKVLMVQIYLRQDNDLQYNESTSVYWDPRIELSSPLVFRQLRSRPRIGGCSTEFTTESFVEQIANITAPYVCRAPVESGNMFDTRPIPMPSSGYPPLLGEGAYLYSDTCSEDEPKTFYGKFADYPCSGHSVAIHNRSQLQALIDSRWIDGLSRIAAITAKFSFGMNLSTVEYTMLMEFSENGGGSFGRAFGFPLTSDSDLADLGYLRTVFQVVVVLDLIMSSILTGRYLVARFVQKLPHADVEDLWPGVPFFTLLVAFATFIATNIAFPPAQQDYRNGVTVTIIAAIYLQYHFTTSVVFPAASLLSKQVKILIKALGRALTQLIFVIPYYLVLLWGFLLCGYLIFGRFVNSFGRVRWAITQITLMTFGGGVDAVRLQNARFVEAQLFVFLFFAAVLVVLANMFLAMVTSATNDAQDTKPAVALCENVLRLLGHRVMYGKFLRIFLFVSVKLVDSDSVLRHILPSFLRRPRTKEAALMFDGGRVLFPTEVLVTSMHPLRVNDVLTVFPTDRLNSAAYTAVGPFLLENFHRFVAAVPHKAAHDLKLLHHRERLACVARRTLTVGQVRPRVCETDYVSAVSDLADRRVSCAHRSSGVGDLGRATDKKSTGADQARDEGGAAIAVVHIHRDRSGAQQTASTPSDQDM
jgi:hypothetical protein